MDCGLLEEHNEAEIGYAPLNKRKFSKIYANSLDFLFINKLFPILNALRKTKKTFWKLKLEGLVPIDQLQHLINNQ